jgi:hypothetical protein
MLNPKNQISKTKEKMPKIKSQEPNQPVVYDLIFEYFAFLFVI